MTTTTFPALATAITWKDTLTDANGNPLPAGETIASVTLGIRADGDTAHSLGNYSHTVIVLGTATTETLSALNSALGAALSPGNYWLNGQETATLNGQSATSAWGATETPFSIPQPVVQPGSPSAFSVA